MASPLAQEQSTWRYVGQNTFGSFLSRERARRGLSRHSLAVITGIQERRLTAIELNQSPPSYQDIKNFATVLEIPEQLLLEAAGCVRAQRGRNAHGAPPSDGGYHGVLQAREER